MKPKNVLVIAAHPDDELLGVAGTLALHAGKGDVVSVAILGQGVMSREDGAKEDVAALQAQTRKAAEIVGIKEVVFEDLPDNAFDTVALLRIAKTVERLIERFRPDIIYTHHAHDLNVDHRLTNQAVITACRPCAEHVPAEIYTYETLSSTEWQSKSLEPFRPNVYVDIASTLEKKLAALAEYRSEMRPYPHSRSLEGIRILAQYRGLESGYTAAEAFHLERRLSGALRYGD